MFVKSIFKPVPTHPRRHLYEYVCDCCGKTYVVNGSYYSRKQTAHYKALKDYCSNDCKFNAISKGGWKHTNQYGYVVITVSRDTPNSWYSKSCGKYGHSTMTEHRYVMQNSLGRALRKDESVHHKNGNKADNRLENLELRCRFHGKGSTTYTEEVNKLLHKNKVLQHKLDMAIITYDEALRMCGT